SAPSTSSMTSTRPVNMIDLNVDPGTEENPIFDRSEAAFSDAFRKGDSESRHCSSSGPSSSIHEESVADGVEWDDEVGPSRMVSYLNGCLQRAKRVLREKGVTVATVDEQGRQVRSISHRAPSTPSSKWHALDLSKNEATQIPAAPRPPPQTNAKRDQRQSEFDLCSNARIYYQVVQKV
ncbi:hypothetical protein PMAYCL1PPCAC_16018, partial [Pristionchus mayeri]